MSLTVIAVSLAVLAIIAVACVVLGLVLYLGRDRSFSHPTINEQLARDDALAQNIADRVVQQLR
jgi:hypothetical protein